MTPARLLQALVPLAVAVMSTVGLLLGPLLDTAPSEGSVGAEAIQTIQAIQAIHASLVIDRGLALSALPPELRPTADLGALSSSDEVLANAVAVSA